MEREDHRCWVMGQRRGIWNTGGQRVTGIKGGEGRDESRRSSLLGQREGGWWSKVTRVKGEDHLCWAMVQREGEWNTAWAMGFR